jgi:serine/threonine protein kinase
MTMTGQRVSLRTGSEPDVAGTPMTAAGTGLAPAESGLAARAAESRVRHDYTSEPGVAWKRCPTCAERFPGDFRVCPRDATELEQAPEEEDPLLGSVLGDSYEVTRVIGEGGMGRVYEARHMRLANKRFAIKVLHAELARQTDIVGRFQREAEATSVLNHANVVAVVDVNRTPDGRPFIVAELLEGEQLGDYLERVGSLGVGEAVEICRQICAALIEAHANDIVHRDIKPENVFLVGVTGRRAVKVLDFGISRVGEGSGSLTKTGIVMGTPAYMPPEQARGQRVDHRADIYAVGAILYQAVTGARPFDGPDLMATLASVISDEPARPCTLNAALPPALEMTIQRAMAKNPNERHRTMQELDADLARFDPAATAKHAATERLSDANTLPIGKLLGDVVSREASKPARRARLQIVLLSLTAAVWLLAGLLECAISAIRWVRGTSALSATELILTCAGAGALLIAPTIAWQRHVRQRTWPSTPRAVELAGRMRVILLAALVTYAVASLAIRVLESLVHADPAALGWPGWAVLTFGAASASGLIAWFATRRRTQ